MTLVINSKVQGRFGHSTERTWVQMHAVLPFWTFGMYVQSTLHQSTQLLQTVVDMCGRPES